MTTGARQSAPAEVSLQEGRGAGNPPSPFGFYFVRL